MKAAFWVVMAMALLTMAAQAQVGIAPPSCVRASDVASDPLAGDKDHPVCISSGVIAGNLLRQVRPIYPMEAWKARVPDGIVVRALINPQGDIEDLQVISGPEMVREPWLKAIRQWKYKPFFVDERAVYVMTTITTHASHGSPPQEDAQSSTGKDEAPVGTRENPVRVSSGVIASLLVHQVKPIFPPIPPNAHVAGTTIIRAIIDDQGKIIDLQPISGPEILRQPVMDAVRQWQYKPYLLNGKPVFVLTTIGMNIDFGG